MNKFYKKFIFIFLFLIILNLTLSVVSAVDVNDVGTILNNDSDDIEYIDVGLNDNSIDVNGNVLDEDSEDVNNESFNPNISNDFNSDEAIFDKSVETYNLDNYDSKDIVITNLKEDSSKINSILEGVNNCIWLWPSNVNSINLTLLADSGINNII